MPRNKTASILLLDNYKKLYVTELYFRQILGRILRVNEAINQDAWLFTFTEESLVVFAERIEQDTPDTCRFIKQRQPDAIVFNKQPYDHQLHVRSEMTSRFESLDWGQVMVDKQWITDSESFGVDKLRLGRFREKVIAAFV